MKKLLVVVLLLAAPPAWAQSTALDRPFKPLPTVEAQHAASVLSWVTLGTAIALDGTRTLYDHCLPRDRGCKRAVLQTGVRLGLTAGAVAALKIAVHRTRPCAPACGVDNPRASFPSGHTAEAFSTVGGGSIGVFLPLAVGTGGLRIAANKHWLTDTLAGACVGLGSRWLSQRIIR